MEERNCANGTLSLQHAEVEILRLVSLFLGQPILNCKGYINLKKKTWSFSFNTRLNF